MVEPEPGQPFDEFALLLMPRPDRGEAATEVGLIFLRNGQSLEIGEQICRTVIA